MKPMKVIVTEELDAKVRQRAAASKGLRKGALSEAVSEALERWLGEEEPELYIGFLEDGISLEVPPRLVPALLQALAETTHPNKVRLYYREDGEEKMTDLHPQALSKTLHTSNISPTDPHFIAEMDGFRVYTGGGGCISIEGKIPTAARGKIIQSILSGRGLEVKLPQRTPLHVMVRKGRVEFAK